MKTGKGRKCPKGSALAGVSGEREEGGIEKKEKGRGGEGKEKWRKRVNVQYVS